MPDPVTTKEMMLTTEHLRELLHYDPHTGIFTWKTRAEGMTKRALSVWNSRYAGTVAGSPDWKGYLCICISIDGKKIKFRSHRLAWLYMTGKWPEDEVDHIDLNKANNSWLNLRKATASQNHGNKRKQANNTSGHKGVWWSKQHQRWIAETTHKGVKHHIGIFKEISDAALAYNQFSKNLRGEFSRTEI